MHTSDSRHSFAWLNATQFFGALNDNAFKLLIIFFLVDQLGLDQKATIGMAAIIFVIPFLLFSHAAGILADRYSKQHIVFYAKCAELALMILGLAAVLLQLPYLLYLLLFLMCTQSAFFGPSKYGIIPELVRRDQLSKANSFLIGLTYLAIIIGTFIPSLSLKVFFNNSFIGLALVSVGIAVAGLVCSTRIEETTPMGRSEQRFTPLFFVEIFKTLFSLRHDRYLFLTLPSVAYFLFLGAFLQQNLLLLGPQLLGWDTTTSGYLFPMAAVGIAVGAVAAGRLSGRNIEFGTVPIGAACLTVCCLLLGSVSASVSAIITIVFFTGLGAGLFIVPLQAFIQQRSPRERLGEILACMNFLSFLGVAIAALMFMLLTKGFGMSAQGCFIFTGILTGVLAAIAFRVLPDFTIRFAVLVLTRIIYRIRTIGNENVPLVDQPALLVCNHVTWSDALILSATQQRRIRFIMERRIYRNRWMNPLFRLMRVIPISANDPPHELEASIRQARQALDEGALVCIFPEQWLTRNGNMQRFKAGIGHILTGTNHPIIPVYIGGGWGSVLSHYYGHLMTHLPRRRCRITVAFGPPLPPDTPTFKIRQAVSELANDYFGSRKNGKRTLPYRFVRTARLNFRRDAIADTTGKKLTFGKTLIASVLLGDEIKRISNGADRIGILLPASVGGVLANLAVTLVGKVSVNLNFTASAGAFTSAIRQCGIKTVITAKPFVEKIRDRCPVPEDAVFIEDILAGISQGAKLRALAKALIFPAKVLARTRQVSPDDIATILFSSGSTGEPKGIMLSHHNLLSNFEGFAMVLRLQKTDRLCAVLPLFHSFGYTATFWTPLLSGFPAWYHPNPVEGAVIAEMVRENRLTLLFGTPTFLLTYMHKATEADFSSLRFVVAGAEKLKKKLADRFEERYGIRPMEGYGATELSPVAAVNLPDVDIDGIKQVGWKVDSIGHPIPGIAVKIVHPDSLEELGENQEGLLLVKGPNVMQGYLGNPEKTSEVLKDGWYVTGDIARIDQDGFIFLLDRLSRYSKIGGEMVPHLAVEEALLQGLEATGQVVYVTSAPDERKGEQLVVLYTADAGDADVLRDIVKHSSLPNLWHPHHGNYFLIDEMPALGSGKLDMKQLKILARELVESA